MNLQYFGVFYFGHSTTVQQHHLHPTGIMGASSDNAKKAVEPVFSKTHVPISLYYVQLREHSLHVSVIHSFKHDWIKSEGC